MGFGETFSSDVVLRSNSWEKFSPGFPRVSLQSSLRMLMKREKPVLSLPASFEPEESLRSSVLGSDLGSSLILTEGPPNLEKRWRGDRLPRSEAGLSESQP